MKETGGYGKDDELVWLTVKCGQCSHTTFTSRLRQFMPTASDILHDHLAQHGPGRALDIEVDWEPSANCSVCPDGIGMIKFNDDGEGLACTECGTEWDMDGKDGATL